MFCAGKLINVKYLTKSSAIMKTMFGLEVCGLIDGRKAAIVTTARSNDDSIIAMNPDVGGGDLRDFDGELSVYDSDDFPTGDGEGVAKKKNNNNKQVSLFFLFVLFCGYFFLYIYI